MKLFYDVETIKGCFLACFYDPESSTWWDFWVYQGRNDLYKLMKYLEEHSSDVFIGFNNVSFDGCIIEYVWRSHKKWYNKLDVDISGLIWQKAQDIIDDTNYGLFPPYREYELTFRQLDVFKIQHFDNKNLRVGLKRLEYEMDMEDIEDMPVPHDKMEFSGEELTDLLYYCHNDVIATHLNYLYVIGEVEHSLYKGNDQVAIREALTEEFGVDCTNYSNSKYGDEIIKLLYSEHSGVSYRNLPKKGTFRRLIKLKNCIPGHISFKTKQLKEFLEAIRGAEIKSGEEFKHIIQFGGQEYTFAKGGIHNTVKNKQYNSDDEWIIIDADVTSYYPATIINNDLCPLHLNKGAFRKAYTWIYNERVRLKPLAKADKKIKGIVGGYKEAAVSVYGKSGDPDNWMYDPQMMLTTCIAGEFSIMMLIEAQYLAGNQCIMANTDGASFYIKRSKLEEFHGICSEWCEKTQYKLEYFEFKSIWFSNVNSYIGVKTDGEVKKKNEFMTDSELRKNKSFRVVALALSKYFLEGIAPEDFIGSFDNIFHFCGRSSSGQVFRHKGYAGNDSFDLPKLVRYYVAKDGIHIVKEVKEGNDTGANDMGVTPADRKKTVCNKLPPNARTKHLENVDRQWYIDKTNEIIYAIEKGKRPKRGAIDDKNQLNLF